MLVVVATASDQIWGDKSMSMLDRILENVIVGDVEQTKANVTQAIRDDIEPEEILAEALIPAMAEVGRLFEEGDYYVPELLIAARAMLGGLSLVKPKLSQNSRARRGRVAIGTVMGDLHDIGKKLVAMMLEGAGFQVEDLGVDVPPQRFVEAAQNGAQIIGLSALLTTTMPMMQATVDALANAGVRDRVCVIVGGAPLTPAYASSIGADLFAPDASAAARMVSQWADSVKKKGVFDSSSGGE